MKKILAVFLLINVVLSIAVFSGCNNDGEVNSDCVRIHIRANSNLDADQSVKMNVVAAVVEYLTPVLAECETASEAKTAIEDNLAEIESVADKKLAELGEDYKATASLSVEDFPTRQYLDYVFPSGKYDALIIELGEGAGDNWWCVAFPPLCFVPAEEGSDNFKYKSKIVEIIEDYFGSKDE